VSGASTVCMGGGGVCVGGGTAVLSICSLDCHPRAIDERRALALLTAHLNTLPPGTAECKCVNKVFGFSFLQLRQTHMFEKQF
jgi:hypothetical protein